MIRVVQIDRNSPFPFAVSVGVADGEPPSPSSRCSRSRPPTRSHSASAIDSASRQLLLCVKACVANVSTLRS